MTDNRAFWKAFHSLVHPLSLLAIVLLLINDNWLRYAHPSWLTGKLGDFTWLVFAPFITALFFAWLIPRRWEHHIKIVGWLSIGFIGVWFATAKTIPFVHELTTQTLYAIVGWEGQLRLDITDLLTLPALLISLYIWRNASDAQVSLKPLAYIAFGLGMLGTLASDDTYFYDYGVTHICEKTTSIYTITQTINGRVTEHHSSNGGLLWRELSTQAAQYNYGYVPVEPQNCKSDPSPQTIQTDDGTIIRWTPDARIESSTDGGQTWQIEHDLPELEQDVRTYQSKYGPADYSYLIIRQPSPADAIYDQTTGNIIFAMGHFGVLVRTPDATYTWVTVGDYGLATLLDPVLITDAIFFELWLGLAMMFLIITTSTVYMRRPRRTIKAFLILMSWLGYITILGMIFTERMDDIYLTYYSLTALLSLGMLVFFGIPLSIGAVWDVLVNFRSVIKPLLLSSIGTALLFVLPFFLWTQARIPRYSSAFAFALFLTVIGLYASTLYLRRSLPVIEPEKGKRDFDDKEKHISEE